MTSPAAAFSVTCRHCGTWLMVMPRIGEVEALAIVDHLRLHRVLERDEIPPFSELLEQHVGVERV